MDESLPDSKHTGCISTSAILSNNYDIKGSVFKVHLCPTHYRAHACKWRKWCRKRSHSPSVTSLKCLIRLLWHKFWAKKNMKIQSMLTEPIDDFAHQWLLSTHFAHWRLWSTGIACQWLSLTGFAHQQLLSTDFTHQSILLQIQAQLDTELFRIYTCMSMCYQMETCRLKICARARKILDHAHFRSNHAHFWTIDATATTGYIFSTEERTVSQVRQIWLLLSHMLMPSWA